MNIFASHNAYVDFFKALATRFIPISHTEEEPHFARIIDTTGSPFAPYYYAEEFTENVLRQLKPPYFILETFREQTSGPRTSKKSVYDCGFMILDQVDRNRNYDLANDVLDETGPWADQLIAMTDAELMSVDSKLSLVDWDSVLIHKVGPIKENIYGHRVDFKVKRMSQQKFCIDEDLWTVA